MSGLMPTQPATTGMVLRFLRWEPRSDATSPAASQRCSECSYRVSQTRPRLGDGSASVLNECSEKRRPPRSRTHRAPPIHPLCRPPKLACLLRRTFESIRATVRVVKRSSECPIAIGRGGAGRGVLTDTCITPGVDASRPGARESIRDDVAVVDFHDRDETAAVTGG
jgi:hypothetical protein